LTGPWKRGSWLNRNAYLVPYLPVTPTSTRPSQLKVLLFSHSLVSTHSSFAWSYLRGSEDGGYSFSGTRVNVAVFVPIGEVAIVGL
jgi:hypothetical protein